MARKPLDDVEIAYLTWGNADAPKVLLLHGYLDVAESWADIAEALSTAFFVVAPHFRGHGDSGWCDGFAYMMPNYLYDTVSLVDALGWSSFSVVGHSMGANCASLLAGTFPDRIERLVMLEGFGVPFWTPDQAPEKLAQHIQERAQIARPAKAFDTMEEVVERIRRDHPHASETTRLRMASARVRQGEDGRWRWKYDPRLRWPNPLMYLQVQFEAFWKRITCPTLQVLGAESSFLAWLTPDSFASIPQMRGAVMDRAGHALHIDQPQATAEIVRAFLLSETKNTHPIDEIIASLG